jgi:hypothetical protein
MPTGSVACKGCKDTGLIALNAACASGRCDHGSNVELCYKACGCSVGADMKAMLSGLREPKRTPEQNRAIVEQYRADRKLAGVSIFSITKIDASRAA